VSPHANKAAAPLRSPPFRRYLIGQLPSVTGSWIQVVSLSWIVVERYPAALGWIVALQFAPSLLLGPWFGAVTDRHDRRRILIFAESGLGLVAAGFGVAAATDQLTLPLVCALAATWGVINAIDTPARQALVPSLVPRGQAASASALTGMVLLIGMTAGSALGALVVAAAGVAVAFGVNAASFLLDVILLLTIHIGPSPRVPRATRQLRDGLHHVWHERGLRRPLLTVAVLGSLTFTIPVSAPTLVRASFEGGSSMVGAALTAVAAGGLGGAAFAALRGAPAPRSLRRAALIMAAATTVTAWAPSVSLALVGLVGVGFGWSLVIASTIALLQATRPTMLGRVMSWLAVVLVGGTAVGGPLAGAVAGTFGPRAPFLLGAIAAVLAGLVAGPSVLHDPGVVLRVVRTTAPSSRRSPWRYLP
jgi:MFS family permease